MTDQPDLFQDAAIEADTRTFGQWVEELPLKPGDELEREPGFHWPYQPEDEAA